MAKKLDTDSLIGVFHEIKRAIAGAFDNLSPAQKAEIKGETGQQGPVGPQGATSVYDSTTQNFLTTLETTTGQDQTKTMTQKAITDEFDKFTEEAVTLTWVEGGVSSQGIDDSTNGKKTNRRSNTIYFDTSEYGKVKVSTPNNKTKFAIYSVKTEGGTTTYAMVNQGGFINSPADYWFEPQEGVGYIIRVSTPAATEAATNALVSSDFPTVTKYHKSVAHAINDQGTRLDAIEMGLNKETIIPTYRLGSVSSQGYIEDTGNKISQEMAFDTNKISSVTIHCGTGVKYTVYSREGNTFALIISGGYVTDYRDFTFTPEANKKYIVRFAANKSNPTSTDLNNIPQSSYPVVIVKYANAVQRLDNINNRVSMLEAKNYAYHRNYSNITPLLNFESKTISSNGIEANNSKLLAKLPNIGSVEVKMNKPSGGFSVWKKVGSTITCLQEYNHAQYRYNGDYESEYYVLVEAESGSSVSASIVLVYVYSDEGKSTSYKPPSWAKGVKIAFLGDSIVQGRCLKNNDANVNICMDKPWPNIVAENLATEDYKNFAIGGALVYDSTWRSIADCAENVSGYDVVFVCGGTNDYGNKTSQANFEATYASMLSTLVENNTKVIAITPVTRTKTVSNPAMNFSAYAASVISVANAASVPVIDARMLTDTDDFKAHLTDGLHPDMVGHRIIADVILEAIKNIEWQE